MSTLRARERTCTRRWGCGLVITRYNAAPAPALAPAFIVTVPDPASSLYHPGRESVLDAQQARGDQVPLSPHFMLLLLLLPLPLLLPLTPSLTPTSPLLLLLLLPPRRDEACLDYAGTDVILYPCHGSKGNQYWQYEHASRTLR